MNLRLRHYWIKVDYDNQYSLQENGDLAENILSINHNDFDSTFNAFNLDFVAKWQFAPASELSLGYVVGKIAFSNIAIGDYIDGLDRVSDVVGSETLSLRVRRFLDFNELRAK